MSVVTKFVASLRSAKAKNSNQMFDNLKNILAKELIEETELRRVLRHIDTLVFNLSDKRDYVTASQLICLKKIIDKNCLSEQSDDENNLRLALRQLSSQERWTDLNYLSRAVRRAFSNKRIIWELIREQMRIGWHYECCHNAEGCIQSYRAAFELNGGDEGILTPDGDNLRKKIKLVRILQRDALVKEGEYDKAIQLHEQTRDIINAEPLQKYSILSARDAAENGMGLYKELVPLRLTSPPELHFVNKPAKLTTQCGLLECPPQYYAQFESCLTFPRSNLVLHNDRLIYDTAAHPLQPIIDIKDGVNPGQIIMASYGATSALIETPKDYYEIKSGLMMFGFQSANYGHWMLEFIPRMLWFNNSICPQDYPICIDVGMPSTHRDIINILNKLERPIIELEPKPTKFGSIGLAPVPTFFPFDMQPNIPVYDTIWPEDILTLVRQQIIKRLSEIGSDFRSRRRRLFISRKSYKQRQLLNEDEIIQTLTRHHFEVVRPEELDFKQQVELYHSADIIVGSASSALTNCLFCKPGTRIIALAHESPAFTFRVFASMIRPSKSELIFVRGQTLHSENAHALHANYTIDPGQVLSAIDTVGWIA